MQPTIIRIPLLVDDFWHIDYPFSGLAVEFHIVSEYFNMMEVKDISLLWIQ
jgi:hypothetical protein